MLAELFRIPQLGVSRARLDTRDAAVERHRPLQTELFASVCTVYCAVLGLVARWGG